MANHDEPPYAEQDEQQPAKRENRSEPAEKPRFTACPRCSSTGVCLACKGSGKSGYFLKPPSADAPACSHCRGTGKCRSCEGEGRIKEPTFQPYIYVGASLSIPTSITAAAFGGMSHRYIKIPIEVLQRSNEAQRDWVAGRIKKHYDDHDGKCFLFGDIVSYHWFTSPGHSVGFAIDGSPLANAEGLTMPGRASIAVGNKRISTDDDGSLVIKPNANL